MAEYSQRLVDEPELAERYRAAHEQYLADRKGVLVVDEVAGYSAGGMPTRVKCLHALAAHALAAGPGVNPLGDETLARIGPWWHRPCLPAPVTRGEGPVEEER